MKISLKIILFLVTVGVLNSCKPVSKIPSTSNFRGTVWELKLMHGTQYNLLTQKISIIFDPKDTTSYSSFAGCNQVKGKYIKEKLDISLESPISTKMACPALKTEDDFLEVLSKAERYAIKSHVMYFYNKKDYILAVFDANYLKK